MNKGHRILDWNYDLAKLDLKFEINSETTEFRFLFIHHAAFVYLYQVLIFFCNLTELNHYLAL